MLFQTTSAHEELRAKIRSFAEEEIKPLAFLMDQNNEFPEEAVKKLGKLGWMGIPYPKEYGGAGLDALSYAIAVVEMARVDGRAGAAAPLADAPCDDREHRGERRTRRDRSVRRDGRPVRRRARARGGRRGVRRPPGRGPASRISEWLAGASRALEVQGRLSDAREALLKAGEL